MMAGVNPGAVQRILRPTDPRITTEIYGHLAPDYLRGGIDRLRFSAEPANNLSGGSQPSAAVSQSLLQPSYKHPEGCLSPGALGRLSRRDPRASSCGVDGT